VLLGRGQRRRTASAKASVQAADRSKLQISSDASEHSKQAYEVNGEGRYVCYVCEKTFKTVSC